MSIFGKILSRVLNPHQPVSETMGNAPGASENAASAAATVAAGVSAIPVAPSPAGATQPPVAPPVAPIGAQTLALDTVDVEAVLEDLARRHEKLNWRISIVDLLKLLGLDSSQSARKELAQELEYKGDANDSATMNGWLHKAVMRKLAENGGKVPADLRD